MLIKRVSASNYYCHYGDEDGNRTITRVCVCYTAYTRKTPTTCGKRAITMSNRRDYRGCNTTNVSVPTRRENRSASANSVVRSAARVVEADTENCLHVVRRFVAETGFDPFERTHVDGSARTTTTILFRDRLLRPDLTCEGRRVVTGTSNKTVAINTHSRAVLEIDVPVEVYDNTSVADRSISGVRYEQPHWTGEGGGEGLFIFTARYVHAGRRLSIRFINEVRVESFAYVGVETAIQSSRSVTANISDNRK